MITGVHISSSEIIINKAVDKKNNLPGFTKNQIINARVLQLLPPDRAQLLVNGQKVVARTTLLLTPGEQLQLKVLQETDAVILKLIGPVQKMTTRQLSTLIGFFSKHKSIPDISGIKIPAVKELLYDMALKSDQPDGTFLPKLLEKSGMVWEKKVARMVLGNSSSSDIKAGLESLLHQDIKGTILKELFMADPLKSDVLKPAAFFTETLENFQMLNHQSSESGRFLLPFPIFSEGTFRFGQLFIDTGDKPEENPGDTNKVIQVSFLLDMTRLGPLRADFSILKKEITGRFLLKDEETCNYVQSMIPALITGLSDIEYHVRKIDCHTAPEEEIQQSRFIATLVKTRDDSMLNIVI